MRLPSISSPTCPTLTLEAYSIQLVICHRLGCSVTSVDRSPLDPILMNDKCVTFIAGDAFRYTPPWGMNGEESDTPAESKQHEEGPTYWMVSDVVAYPKRAVELVTRWATAEWAQVMVITMKFQGDEVDWDAIHEAAAVARQCGYTFRSKHFFSNKNEVTMMLRSHWLEKEMLSS